MKKYELVVKIEFKGIPLYRIRSLIDFNNVKAGDLGSYIQSEKNLSHLGNAWVSGNACVGGNARVSGIAEISGNACVSDTAKIFGNAEIGGNAIIK